MVNIAKLMKQAASMQKNMEKVQEDLAQREYESSSGGGMVKACARGDMTLIRVELDPKVIDPDDPEMLQDMITAAVNGALSAAREDAAGEMQKVTGGMGGLPGMGMPGM